MRLFTNKQRSGTILWYVWYTKLVFLKNFLHLTGGGRDEGSFDEWWSIITKTALTTCCYYQEPPLPIKRELHETPVHTYSKVDSEHQMFSYGGQHLENRLTSITGHLPGGGWCWLPVICAIQICTARKGHILRQKFHKWVSLSHNNSY